MAERTNEREWEPLEKEAICSECSNLFTEPKTLPCLHTFCAKCLETEPIVSSGVCPVPLCQAKLPQNITVFPTDTFYKCMVDLLRKRKAASSTEADIRCGECKDSPPAVRWCTTCVNFLCRSCYWSHDNMNIFSLHKTITIDEFLLQSPTDTVLNAAISKAKHCMKHNSELQEIHCKTCDTFTFICRKCPSNHQHGHQYSVVTATVNKLAVTECDKIKVVRGNLKGLLEQVRVAKEEVGAVENDVNNEATAEKRIREAYKKLHENLEAEEANALKRLEDYKDSCHKSLCEQKGQISCLEYLLISCDEFVSKVTSKERACQLLTHSNDIQKRVNDLTNQVKQSSLKPVCGVDDLSDYVTSLCKVSSNLPDIPNCTVKGPPTMSKYGPINVTIILKDKDGRPVPNQTEYLTFQFKDENIACDIKMEEDVSGSVYVLSYRAKRREMHSLSISWKGQLLDEITVQATKVRDYPAIKKPVQGPITKYGEQKEITCPHLMALGPNDELIVRDCHEKSLVVFDRDLKFSHMIAVGEPAPTGLAIGKGHLYMSIDSAIKKVQMNGKLVFKFGTKGTEDSQFNSPRGLVLGKNGQLYVCDKDNHRIQVLQENQFLFSFGKNGKLPGMFNKPYDLAFNNAEDLLIITDCGNHRIQLFTPSGQFLKLFGNFFEIPGKLRFPTGIFYAPDDHVLVCSSNSHCMLIFKDDGTFVSSVAIEGVDGKQDADPVGVVMKNDGRIIVAGCNSNKLVVF